MNSAGTTWTKMLRDTLAYGVRINEPTGDYFELEGLQFSVSEPSPEEPAFKRFVPAENILEMEKVFLTSEPNRFGHSYWELICGGKENQIEAAITALKNNSNTRKAIIVLGAGGKSVPCINAMHFYLRDGCVHLSYFSRGQDLWVKFAPDLLALRRLQEMVAKGVNARPGNIRGFISSAHIYVKDQAAASQAAAEISA